MLRGMRSLALAVLVCLPSLAHAQAPAPAKAEVTLTNLYDAFGKPAKGATQDYGYSALIKYKGKTILFDAGSNADTFKKNALALGADLKKIDFAVISHDHFDHTSGFDWLLKVNPKVKIYAPNDRWMGAPTTFDLDGRNPDIAKQLPEDMRYFGGAKSGAVELKTTGRFWNANVEWVKESKEIAPGITLVATESQLLGDLTKYPGTITDPTKDPAYEDKFLPLPELSLSLSTSKGEVIVVGCSHASVDVIVVKAKETTKREPYALVGGYHLIPYDATYVNGVAKRLKDTYGVKKVGPAHCTGHLAFKILKDLYKDDYLLAGLGSKLEL